MKRRYKHRPRVIRQTWAERGASPEEIRSDLEVMMDIVRAQGIVPEIEQFDYMLSTSLTQPRVEAALGPFLWGDGLDWKGGLL